MSVKNKAKDRDDRGKIKRRLTGPESTQLYTNTPTWWVRLYMTRPARRRNRWLCKAVRDGADPDAVVWPLGNHKPHEYFW